MPITPWEKGAAWPDGGGRFEKLRLFHRRLMDSDPHPSDKCGHN